MCNHLLCKLGAVAKRKTMNCPKGRGISGDAEQLKLCEFERGEVPVKRAKNVCI